MTFTKEGYIYAPSFCNEFHYNRNAVYQMYAKKHPLIHKRGKQIYVDYNGLMKRKEFHKRIWLKAHDNYYDLMEHFKIETRLAKWLSQWSDFSQASWVDFLARHLFMLPTEDLFGYKVSARLWRFYRMSNRLLKSRDRREKFILKLHPNLDRYTEICKERGVCR